MAAGNGVIDLAKRGLQLPVDLRLTRVKLLAVDVGFAAALFQMDGTYGIKFDGWPKDAIILNVETRIAMTPEGTPVPQFVFLLHHPDFPVVLGAQPPKLSLTYKRVPVAAEEDVGEGEADEGQP